MAAVHQYMPIQRHHHHHHQPPHQWAPQHHPILAPMQPLVTTHQQANLTRSGIWSQEEDEALLRARAKNEGWGAIASNYFQGKTGNACRKRHERLKKKEGGGSDGPKLEMIAKEYLLQREGLWRSLADRCGESWKDVEKTCMEQGLNNLKVIGRRASRGESMSSPNDDSGIGHSGMSDASGATGRSRRTSTSIAMGFDQILTSGPE